MCRFNLKSCKSLIFVALFLMTLINGNNSFAANIYFAGEKYHKNLKSSLASTLEEETGLSIRSMGQATAQPVLRGYTGDRFLLT